jgi:hypothetical protein
MLIIELITGRPPEPTLMASIMAVFLSASLGTCFGLLVYSLLCAGAGDSTLPPQGVGDRPPGHAERPEARRGDGGGPGPGGPT